MEIKVPERHTPAGEDRNPTFSCQPKLKRPRREEFMPFR
jgi:hypothetical protein